MKLTKFMLTCAGLLVAAWGNAQAGPIAIISQSTETYAGTYIPQDFASAFYMGTALDGTDHVSAAVHSSGTYTTTINLSEQAQSATLDYGFSGTLSAVTSAALSLTVTKFSASGSNLAYSVSGDYSYSYPGPFVGFNQNIFADLYVHLLDLSTNTMLFVNRQTSTYATGPFAFTVGGTAGTLPYALDGSLSGALVSGNEYEFVYAVDSRAGNVSTFSADGNVLLNVTSDVAEVPEPASLTLFGLGGLVFALRRRARHTF